MFLILRALLPDLIGDPWMIVGCAVGSTLSTFVFYTDRNVSSIREVLSALGIVLGTFVAISIGAAVGMVAHDHKPLDWNLFQDSYGIFMWAVLATSWWLVPVVLVTWWAFDRLVERGSFRR